MRIRLLIPAATAALACSGAAGAAVNLPGSAYRWVQPGTAPVVATSVEPAVVVVPVVATQQAVSAYVWAQPGTAARHAPYAQPW